MKVLYLPLNTPDFTQNGMVDAFKYFNVDLEVFDYNMMSINKIKDNKISNNLLNKVEEYSPDLIHCQLQFSSIINNETLKKIKQIKPKTIISNWSGDIRQNVPKEYIETSKYIDFNLISSSGQIEMYSQKCGKQIYYWQIGFDPKIYFPLNNSNFTYKNIFIGNNWNTSGFPGQKERLVALKKLKSEFNDKFALFGQGWESEKLKSNGILKLKDLNNYYNNSFSCTSINNFNNVAHYFSDRLLLSMASGRPVIALSFPKYEDYFINGEEILIANSPEDITSKVLWCLKNEEKANDIGKNGHLKIKNEHTYSNRVLELFKITGFI